MKPFDLEAAKRGEPICYADGSPVRFVAHIPEANDAQCVVAASDAGVVILASKTGLRSGTTSNIYNLMMAPTKTIKLWIVARTLPDTFIKTRCFESEADAVKWLANDGAQLAGAWHGPYPLEVLDK